MISVFDVDGKNLGGGVCPPPECDMEEWKKKNHRFSAAPFAGRAIQRCALCGQEKFHPVHRDLNPQQQLDAERRREANPEVVDVAPAVGPAELAAGREYLALRAAVLRFLEDCQKLLLLQPGPQRRIADLERALQDERNAQRRGDGLYTCPTCQGQFRWSDGALLFDRHLNCNHPQMPALMRLVRWQRDTLPASKLS